MTVAEFKILSPEQAHLEGNTLWDAMTHYLIEHPELQSREEDPLSSVDFSNWGILIPRGTFSDAPPRYKTNLKNMYDITELAMKMYDAYCVAVGGKAFNGDSLPKSEEFFNDTSKQKQSDAWIEAARVALDELL